MPIIFPSNPGAQNPVNEFSPTSTPVTNTSNNATYYWNGANRQWVYAGPNVDPSPPIPGTGIQTPSITYPTDGATGITPLGQLNIQSSTYTHVIGNPGPHESSNWQVVEGAIPLVSTNTITGIVVTDNDWTDQVVYTETYSSCVIIGGAYVFPNGRAMGIAGSCVIGGRTPADYAVHISDDNGQTWTEDTRMKFGGGNYLCCSTQNSYAWQQFGNVKLRNGNVFALLLSTRADYGRGWWHYDWQTDTYRGFGQGNFGGNQFDYIKGVTYDNKVVSGYPTNRTAIYDPATMSTGGFVGNEYGLPGSMWVFDYDPVKEIYFGCRNVNVNDSTSSAPYVGYFIGTNKDDLRQRNDFIDEFLGSVQRWAVTYSPPLGDFLILCDGGILGRFNTDTMEGTYQNIGITDPLRRYIWADPYHIISNENFDKLVFSTDFKEWTVLTHEDDNVFGPSDYDPNTETFYSIYKDFNAITEIYLPVASQPADKLTMSIAGAQTDGFEKGMEVQNRGGNAAEGVIFYIDDTTVELLPFHGTWSGDGTQKISIAPTAYSVVVDSIEDSSNLTTYPVAASFLNPDSDYRARVQYRSNANVVSDFSLWSSFSTSP